VILFSLFLTASSHLLSRCCFTCAFRHLTILMMARYHCEFGTGAYGAYGRVDGDMGFLKSWMRLLQWPTLGIRLQRMELGSIKGVEGLLSRHGALACCTTSKKLA
jgi:hypothetical protein